MSRLREFCFCAAVVAIIGLSVGCRPSASSEARVSRANVEALQFTYHYGAAWTGREMLLWSGRGGLAFDPERNAWHDIAQNPHADNAIVDPSLLSLDDGNVLAVYWLSGSHCLCFDRYLSETDKWEKIARVPVERFRLINDPQGQWQDLDRPNSSDGKPRRSLTVQGLLKVHNASLAFVGNNWFNSKVVGVRLADNGAVSFISASNAPRHALTEAASYARDGKVLYWGYAHVAENEWAVWDEATDTWTKPETVHPRYSFASCLAGDEVYIFGGAWSSAFGYLLHDGWVYSFKHNSWRPMPLAGGPTGRRDHMMCWTGKQLLLWGGDVKLRMGQTPAPADRLFDSGAAFNPKTGTWRGISQQGEPSPRCGCFCLWTGREMLLWGGYRSGPAGAEFLFEGYAYDPEKDTWRRLPAPRS